MADVTDAAVEKIAFLRAWRPLLVILAYITGVGLSLELHSPGMSVTALIAAGVCLLAVTLLSARWARAAALVIAFLLLGLMAGSLRQQALEESLLAGFEGKWVTAEVTVTKAPRLAGGRLSFRGHADKVVRRHLYQPADENVMVQIYCHDSCGRLAGEQLEEGRRVRVRGVVTEPSTNPGADFDYGLYLRRRGVNAIITTSLTDLEITPGRRGGPAGVVDRLRRHARHSLMAGDWGAAGGLYLGIVLGDTSGVPEDVIDDFRASGLLHLLAVSGQNVVLLGFIVMLICRGLWLPRLVSTAIAAAAIGVYVPLTGADPSIVRAGIVGVLGLAAMFFSRQTDTYHFLALSAAVILTINPNSLFDPGFQLSYAAVLAIFLVAPALSAPLSSVPAILREPVAISAAAGLVTAPILLYHFHQVPLMTIPANVAAAPVSGPVMLMGVLSTAVAPVSGSLNWLLNALAAVCTGYLVTVARFFASLPRATYTGDAPGLLAMSAFYAMLVLMVRAAGKTGLAGAVAWVRQRRSYMLAAVLLPALLIGLAWLGGGTGKAPDSYTVSCLDVGQGDATLIQVPGGATVLIDGGPGSDIVRLLREHGVRRLDAVILTHPHADHLSGLLPVVRKYDVVRFYDASPLTASPLYRDLLQELERQGTPYGTLKRGQVLRFQELQLKVLHPGESRHEDDANADSLVLNASYRGLDILLPGDAEGETLLTLDLEPVDIYKVGHHGSKDDYMEQVLRKIKPQIAVISVGEGNSYGHPAESTLTKLAAAGSRVYRTDQRGTVTISLAGDSMAVRVER